MNLLKLSIGRVYVKCPMTVEDLSFAVDTLDFAYRILKERKESEPKEDNCVLA